MTTQYEFSADSMSDLMPDIERITEQAADQGRDYRITFHRNGAQVAAVVTVYDKTESNDA
jgi:uncharacterized protein YkuJ